jgi:hypothetical protein
MKPIILCTALFAFIITALSCGGGTGQNSTSVGGGGESPTDAYKKLYAAVKSKDIEAIKRQLTKKTIDFGKMAAERNKNPEEKMFANGFTATTFSDSLPTMRDERVNGDMGALEVWNSRDSRWEDLPFIKEDGTWKLAIGELFAGTYQSPGKGLDQKEKEAANAVSNNVPPIASVNTNQIPVVNAMPPEMQKGAPKAK